MISDPGSTMIKPNEENKSSKECAEWGSKGPPRRDQAWGCNSFMINLILILIIKLWMHSNNRNIEDEDSINKHK